MPYPPASYSTQYSFWLRNSFTVIKVHQWTHSHGIHWHFHVTYHPEAEDLIELQNDLLETQLQCQSGGSSLVRWSRVLQKGFMLWISIQYIAEFLQNPGHTGPRIGVLKIRIVPINNSQWPLRKIFAFCFFDLKFCWPRSYGSRGGIAPARRYKEHST